METYWRDTLVDNFENKDSLTCRFCGAHSRNPRSRRQHEMYHVQIYRCNHCPDKSWVEYRNAKFHANHPIYSTHRAPRALTGGRPVFSHWTEMPDNTAVVVRRCIAPEETPTLRPADHTEAERDSHCAAPPTTSPESPGEQLTPEEITDPLPGLEEFTLNEGDMRDALGDLWPDECPLQPIDLLTAETLAPSTHTSTPVPEADTPTALQYLAEARRDLEASRRLQESADCHLRMLEALYALTP